MAVAHVGTSAPVDDNDVGPISPVLPDTTAGYLAILKVGTRSNGDVVQVNSDDGSWTQIVNATVSASRSYLYYRVLTGGDSNPSVTATVGVNAIIASVKVFSGVDTSTPLDVAVSNTASSNSPATAPTITSVTDGVGLLREFNAWASGVSDPTMGNFSEGSAIEDFAAEVRDHAFAATFTTQASAGATGTATADIATANANWYATTLALRPAGGAAVTGRGRLIGGKLVGGILVAVH